MSSTIHSSNSLRGIVTTKSSCAAHLGPFERSAEETNCHPMRIGLFGGTFDPIHWGHLRSAEEVRETFDLDRVFLFPLRFRLTSEGKPRRRRGIGLQMVRLAVAKNPRFKVSTVEIARPGVSYSIDTIRHFAEKKTSGRLTIFYYRSGCVSARSALGRILRRFFHFVISL